MGGPRKIARVIREDGELMGKSGSSGGWRERLFGKQGLIRTVASKRPTSGRRTDSLIRRLRPKDDYPAVVIGSGLGGLSSAAYLARSGFNVKVIEKNDQPGGYATSFQRGEFDFEVSLHTTSINDNPAYRLLKELGVLERVEFQKLPELCRVKTPKHDLTLPSADPVAFKKLLARRFPDQERGIDSLVDEMVGIAEEVNKLHKNKIHFVKLLFPFQYRKMWRARNKSLGDLLDEHLTDREIKSVISAIWPYFGLPPSRLSAFYFANAAGEFINKGCHYPRGRSQDISGALVRIIEDHGGEVILGKEVGEIITRRGAAIGVKDTSGHEYSARAVVSNASAPSTFSKMLPEDESTNGYMDKLRTYRPSLSSFVVWLGLDREIKGEIPQAETFLTTGHDPELDYAAALNVDPHNAPLAVTIYDNIIEDYSPPGRTAVTVMFVCGYQYWKKYEADYRAARKDAYIAEKERIAEIIVKRIDEALVPGIVDMIEELEIATPLTNIRYTGNPEGAIYGYEQSTTNTFMYRIDNRTPIRHLYLASSWGNPGGGFAGALRSGQQTFRCLIDDWARDS